MSGITQPFVSIDPEFDLQEHDNFEFPQQNIYVGEDAAEHFLDDVQTVFKKNIKKLYVHNYIVIERTKQRVTNVTINLTSSCEIIVVFLG